MTWDTWNRPGKDQGPVSPVFSPSLGGRGTAVMTGHYHTVLLETEERDSLSGCAGGDGRS